ncbi:MAG: heparinase II/III family protein [candidate division KSB1 bacterium]|nr:heparinase II/III family protein [candidate division KSB1 bacterium]MDZ7302287.1 heparinase II/III family protein [candidate division KSB1 bacterium]MDZ7311393.1 heparinase II/III family protein [candidate division KSB1 bacterium]
MRLSEQAKKNPLAPEYFLPHYQLPSDFDGPFSDAVAGERWLEAQEYLLEHMRKRLYGQGYNCRAFQFFFSPQQRPVMLQIVDRYLPGLVSQSLAQAERILEHEFSFFGNQIKYADEIEWQDDPLTRRRWPNRFYTEMKYYGQHSTDGGTRSAIIPGDVKYVWELNRHQHFIVLGKAYWFTHDEKYAAEFVHQCMSWIEQNHYLYGVNWTSALEAAMRVISWVWAYFFCLEAQSLDALTHAKILRALQLHGRFISRNLSFYVSPYNHLIGEATALFVLGALFSELPEAERWRRKGWTILHSEVTKQFHADGVSVEQAFAYHHFTLGFYLLAIILAERNGQSLPLEMRQRLERALEFSMFSLQPDGTHPMVGDNDNARSIYFGDYRNWDFRDLLALGAVLFQRSHMKKLAGEFPESCLWLLGPDSYQKFTLLNSSTPVERSKFFQESGYAIFRTGWNCDDHYFIFDCGQQSDGLHEDENVSVAHGHADFFGFTLNAYGVPLLVDAGMLTYNGVLNWQNYFRGASAHNTVTVDGRSPCNLVGRLGYNYVPRVEQSFYSCQADFAFIEGCYTGFGSNIRHRRGVFWRKGDYWLILDALFSLGEHVVERWFHFAPGVEVRISGRKVMTQRRDHKNILLQDLGLRESSCELFEGGEQPSQGWLAPGYGEKIPAPVLCLRLSGLLPMHLSTLILPFEQQTPEIEIQQSGCHSTESEAPFFLCLRTPRWEDRIVFNFTGRLQDINDIRTDARIVYIRHELDSHLAFATIVQGSQLILKNKRLLASELAVDAKISSIALE